MSDRPLSTIDQPFRSSFLSHLDPEDRRITEAFGHRLESAFVDALPGRPAEPFSLTLPRATLEDLDALLLDARDGIATWESKRGETSDELRAAMVEALATLKRARAVLAPAAEAEAGAGDA